MLEGAAGVSNKGKRHSRNEDAMALFVGESYVAAIVCDGVSTSVNPDVASQAAADAACAVLAETPDLEAAYDAARAAVLATEFEPHAELSPPSCTFLAATVTDTAGEVRSAIAPAARNVAAVTLLNPAPARPFTRPRCGTRPRVSGPPWPAMP